MNRYEDHAWEEFQAAGWLSPEGEFKDELQEAICRHLIKLLNVFAEEGHSGTTAPYVTELFSKLAVFKPIAPLTGEEWEWVDVAEQNGGPLYQNKRCGHVFKDPNGAYDIEGIVWYELYNNGETGEKHRVYFTNHKSRVPVTFPYVPKTEYKEWVE